MARDADQQFDVLILGGGNAGLSAAARLLRKGFGRVAVIEPQTVHTYRPLLSYVGGGEADLRRAERTQRSVTPAGCTWIRDTVVAVDASAATVACASGRRYRYHDLVIGTGLVPDDDELPGIDAALQTPLVGSNYLDHAEKTWDLVRSMRPGGHAVFTVPRRPVSCTGTTIKPLFLAAGHWRRTGLLPGVSITLVIDRPYLLGVPALDARLSECLQELDVRVLHSTRVTALQPESSSITVSTGETLTYDMLHLVPPFRGPRWLQDCGLTGDQAHGLVDIDAATFAHREHPNIWAAGDGAAVDTDPSGGALRRQIAILVDNLAAARRGAAMTTYDGYTVAPITTDRHLLIAGEFDRTGAIASSLPSFIDSTRPRRSAWAFDRYVLPQSYWHAILKGRL
ncbi:NAD(P)/FAD-dependent oxidoreductase [Mycolicibacterium rufum]|uniref:NAD(P)/FAD-dependent oxidoreductase n=1 Tax=Mycolicibacterium rufum TaxID=318424 RepID=A0A9X2YIB4_9MYCO|nr:FAD/NAD(P)-binding oxidoreductase [Mycolicibacterium rufum]KGI66465.1 pyridine nucleotide-disulfide oxidoreductase [Mycolicibacterium rufum]MCV7073708.1 NAD(P)/FAD-dependent oxidoreductase [Mycolicibacterium rufum]ULP37230.1 NAD(P)/FAD-dependent oxidoreductase [Mycolicibacterium rufum]